MLRAAHGRGTLWKVSKNLCLAAALFLASLWVSPSLVVADGAALAGCDCTCDVETAGRLRRLAATSTSTRTYTKTTTTTTKTTTITTTTSTTRTKTRTTTTTTTRTRTTTTKTWTTSTETTTTKTTTKTTLTLTTSTGTTTTTVTSTATLTTITASTTTTTTKTSTSTTTDTKTSSTSTLSSTCGCPVCISSAAVLKFLLLGLDYSLFAANSTLEEIVETVLAAELHEFISAADLAEATRVEASITGTEGEAQSTVTFGAVLLGSETEVSSTLDYLRSSQGDLASRLLAALLALEDLAGWLENGGTIKTDGVYEGSDSNTTSGYMLGLLVVDVSDAETFLANTTLALAVMKEGLIFHFGLSTMTTCEDDVWEPSVRGSDNSQVYLDYAFSLPQDADSSTLLALANDTASITSAILEAAVGTSLSSQSLAVSTSSTSELSSICGALSSMLTTTTTTSNTTDDEAVPAVPDDESFLDAAGGSLLLGLGFLILLAAACLGLCVKSCLHRQTDAKSGLLKKDDGTGFSSNDASGASASSATYTATVTSTSGGGGPTSTCFATCGSGGGGGLGGTSCVGGSAAGAAGSGAGLGPAFAAASVAGGLARESGEEADLEMQPDWKEDSPFLRGDGEGLLLDEFEVAPIGASSPSGAYPVGAGPDAQWPTAQAVPASSSALLKANHHDNGTAVGRGGGLQSMWTPLANSSPQMPFGSTSQDPAAAGAIVKVDRYDGDGDSENLEILISVPNSPRSPAMNLHQRLQFNPPESSSLSARLADQRTGQVGETQPGMLWCDSPTSGGEGLRQEQRSNRQWQSLAADDAREEAASAHSSSLVSPASTPSPLFMMGSAGFGTFPTVPEEGSLHPSTDDAESASRIGDCQNVKGTSASLSYGGPGTEEDPCAMHMADVSMSMGTGTTFARLEPGYLSDPLDFRGTGGKQPPPGQQLQGSEPRRMSGQSQQSQQTQGSQRSNLISMSGHSHLSQLTPEGNQSQSESRRPSNRSQQSNQTQGSHQVGSQHGYGEGLSPPQETGLHRVAGHSQLPWQQRHSHQTQEQGQPAEPGSRRTSGQSQPSSLTPEGQQSQRRLSGQSQQTHGSQKSAKSDQPPPPLPPPQDQCGPKGSDGGSGSCGGGGIGESSVTDDVSDPKADQLEGARKKKKRHKKDAPSSKSQEDDEHLQDAAKPAESGTLLPAGAAPDSLRKEKKTSKKKKRRKDDEHAQGNQEEAEESEDVENSKESSPSNGDDASQQDGGDEPARLESSHPSSSSQMPGRTATSEADSTQANCHPPLSARVVRPTSALLPKGGDASAPPGPGYAANSDRRQSVSSRRSNSSFMQQQFEAFLSDKGSVVTSSSGRAALPVVVGRPIGYSDKHQPPQPPGHTLPPDWKVNADPTQSAGLRGRTSDRSPSSRGSSGPSESTSRSPDNNNTNNNANTNNSHRPKDSGVAGTGSAVHRPGWSGRGESGGHSNAAPISGMASSQYPRPASESVSGSMAASGPASSAPSSSALVSSSSPSAPASSSTAQVPPVIPPSSSPADTGSKRYGWGWKEPRSVQDTAGPKSGSGGSVPASARTSDSSGFKPPGRQDAAVAAKPLQGTVAKPQRQSPLTPAGTDPVATPQPVAANASNETAATTTASAATAAATVAKPAAPPAPPGAASSFVSKELQQTEKAPIHHFPAQQSPQYDQEELEQWWQERKQRLKEEQQADEEAAAREDDQHYPHSHHHHHQRHHDHGPEQPRQQHAGPDPSHHRWQSQHQHQHQHQQRQKPQTSPPHQSLPHQQQQQQQQQDRPPAQQHVHRWQQPQPQETQQEQWAHLHEAPYQPPSHLHQAGASNGHHQQQPLAVPPAGYGVGACDLSVTDGLASPYSERLDKQRRRKRRDRSKDASTPGDDGESASYPPGSVLYVEDPEQEWGEPVQIQVQGGPFSGPSNTSYSMPATVTVLPPGAQWNSPPRSRSRSPNGTTKSRSPERLARFESFKSPSVSPAVFPSPLLPPASALAGPASSSAAATAGGTWPPQQLSHQARQVPELPGWQRQQQQQQQQPMQLQSQQQMQQPQPTPKQDPQSPPPKPQQAKQQQQRQQPQSPQQPPQLAQPKPSPQQQWPPRSRTSAESQSPQTSPQEQASSAPVPLPSTPNVAESAETLTAVTPSKTGSKASGLASSDTSPASPSPQPTAAETPPAPGKRPDVAGKMPSSRLSMFQQSPPDTLATTATTTSTPSPPTWATSTSNSAKGGGRGPSALLSVGALKKTEDKNRKTRQDAVGAGPTPSTPTGSPNASLSTVAPDSSKTTVATVDQPKAASKAPPPPLSLRGRRAEGSGDNSRSPVALRDEDRSVKVHLDEELVDDLIQSGVVPGRVNAVFLGSRKLSLVETVGSPMPEKEKKDGEDQKAAAPRKSKVSRQWPPAPSSPEEIVEEKSVKTTPRKLNVAAGASASSQQPESLQESTAAAVPPSGSQNGSPTDRGEPPSTSSTRERSRRRKHRAPAAAAAEGVYPDSGGSGDENGGDGGAADSKQSVDTGLRRWRAAK